MEKNKLLVPIDFTEVSDAAVSYAVEFAKKTNCLIYLLHVIEKPVLFIGKRHTYNNEMIEEATLSRLRKISEEIETNHGVESEIIAISGNIFDTINTVAREVESNFVIMGTHGIKGLQYLRGSNALRVIYHSSVPFILTQKDLPVPAKQHKIVFPIDVAPESAQKSDWAAYLAQRFDSEIHFIVPNETDKYLARKINFNLNFCKKVFANRNIPFIVKHIEEDNNYLPEATIKFAEEINASMIIIMIYPSKGAGEFFITPSQQKIISNPANIPVVCINPGNLFMLQTIV